MVGTGPIAHLTQMPKILPLSTTRGKGRARDAAYLVHLVQPVLVMRENDAPQAWSCHHQASMSCTAACWRAVVRSMAEIGIWRSLQAKLLLVLLRRILSMVFTSDQMTSEQAVLIQVAALLLVFSGKLTLFSKCPLFAHSFAELQTRQALI